MPEIPSTAFPDPSQCGLMVVNVSILMWLKNSERPYLSTRHDAAGKVGNLMLKLPLRVCFIKSQPEETEEPFTYIADLSLTKTVLPIP
jgi:hypothetical protein